MGTKETFERVAEHLYRRQYQSANGQWKTLKDITNVSRYEGHRSS